MLHALEFPFDIMFAATTVVCGGVLERFPRLRVALLEAGSGWGPYLFERLDEHYEKRPGEMPHIPMRRASSSPTAASSSRARPSAGCRTPSRASARRPSPTRPTTRTGTASSPTPSRKIAERDDVSEPDKAAILAGNARRVLGWDA